MRRLASIASAAALMLASASAGAGPPGPGVVGGFAIGGGSGHLAHGDAELGWRFTPTVIALARAQLVVVGERDGAGELGVAVRFDGGDTVHGYLEPQLSRLYYSAEYDCNPGHPGDCWGGDADGFAAGLTAGVHIFTTDHVSGDLRLGATWYHWRDATTNAPNNPVLVFLGGGFSFY